MTIYTNIFEAYPSQVSFQLAIKPKKREQTEIGYRYKSKKGFESLIYDPAIALVIRSTKCPEALISYPFRMVYQIANVLSKVYDSIIEDNKMFIRDNNGNLTADAKHVQENSYKLSAFKTSVVYEPTVVELPDRGGSDYGIALMSGNNHLGSMVHSDVRQLIEALNHFDITTYTMVAGLMERMSAIEDKVDANTKVVYQVLDAINRLNQKQPTVGLPPAEGFQWKSVGPFM